MSNSDAVNTAVNTIVTEVFTQTQSELIRFTGIIAAVFLIVFVPTIVLILKDRKDRRKEDVAFRNSQLEHEKLIMSVITNNTDALISMKETTINIKEANDRIKQLFDLSNASDKETGIIIGKIGVAVKEMLKNQDKMDNKLTHLLILLNVRVDKENQGRQLSNCADRQAQSQKGKKP
ncbi:MAG: hypothetical protein FWG64_00290 [Firmicutes bacterium]|nr:hypothetical protein [Bacillota bacterium]